MRVLMAIGNEELSKLIAAPLREFELDVFQEEVLHRNYLNEMIEQTMPDMLILHDNFLQSDFEDDKEQRDKEMLELIEYWRIKYNDSIRVVYFSLRERNDEFMANLVARNVLDIFQGNSVVVVDLVDQLVNPPKFQNVHKFGIGKVAIEDLPVEDQSLDAEILPEEVVDEFIVPKEEKSSRVKERTEKSSTLKGNLKSIVTTASSSIANQLDRSKIQKILDDNTDVAEIIDLLPVTPVAKEVRSTVIGTVLISVAGVSRNLGCTNTAIAMAQVLASKGHSVALVESNLSEDFERIHYLYEGVKGVLPQDEFEIYGITHFKNRDTIDLNEIFSTFEYVILDYGELDEAINEELFTRSHIKCVLCSADEWKFYQIDDFLEKYAIDQSYCFVVSNGGLDKRDQLEEQMNLKQTYLFPQMDNPYEPSKEVASTITALLGEFLKESNRANKFGFYITGLVSVVATLLVVLLFNVLK